MVFCYYCDIFGFLLPAWLLNCFLIFWHLGLLGNTDRNQCCVIMNERCCQSALDLSTTDVLYVSQGVCRHTDTFALPLSDSAAILIFSGCSRYCFCRHAVYSSDKPSAEVVCFSPHAVPLAHCFTWRCSTNYLMRAGSPAWATAHCTEMKSVCVHTG